MNLPATLTALQLSALADLRLKLVDGSHTLDRDTAQWMVWDAESRGHSFRVWPTIEGDVAAYQYDTGLVEYWALCDVA